MERLGSYPILRRRGACEEELATGQSLISSITLKALANFSPGLRSGNPGSAHLILMDLRNPERVASPFTDSQPAVATPSELRRINVNSIPRVSKQTLG